MIYILKLGFPNKAINIKVYEYGFSITSYRPRTEGLFAKIEKWEKKGDVGYGLNSVFWKITTKENITNIYGLTQNASLAHPKNPYKIFQWFYDAKANI